MEEPEPSVRLLVTARARTGRGVGTAPVAPYERLGFTPADTFTVELENGPWPGQVPATRV